MKTKISAFSLVEILIALIVVSLTAVNMHGLQNKVAQQQRQNIAHALALSIATEKMEKLLSLNNTSELNNISEFNSPENTQAEYSINWNIKTIGEEYAAGDNFKEVALTMNWLNAQGGHQIFKHSQQVSFNPVISNQTESDHYGQLPNLIVSSLTNHEMIYFEENKNYKKGDFVISDSYLYQATGNYSALKGSKPSIMVDPETGNQISAEGWLSYGQVNNQNLSNNSDLAVLF